MEQSDSLLLNKQSDWTTSLFALGVEVCLFVCLQCVCVVVYVCVSSVSCVNHLHTRPCRAHADALVPRCFCGEKTQARGVRPIRLRDRRPSLSVEKQC